MTLDNALFQADGSSNLTFTNNFQINNSASGSTIDANGTTLTIAGNITDGTGAGKLTVADTFGGGSSCCSATTPIAAARPSALVPTLQLGDASHIASIVGDITNDGPVCDRQRQHVGRHLDHKRRRLHRVLRHHQRRHGHHRQQEFQLTAFVENSSAGSANISNTTARHACSARPAAPTPARPAAPPSTTTMPAPSSCQDQCGHGPDHQPKWRLDRFRRLCHRRVRDHHQQRFWQDGFRPALRHRYTRPPAMPPSSTNSNGETEFNASTTAGNATIITNNSGVAQFLRPEHRRQRQHRHQRRRPDPSSTTPTAAPRSSSPSAPASSIFPAASVRTATADHRGFDRGLRHLLYRRRATRWWSAATICRPKSAA